MFWGKPKVEKPPMESRNAHPESPKDPQTPTPEDLVQDVVHAEARFAASKAKDKKPKAALREIAGFPEAQTERKRIMRETSAKRRTLGGRVGQWFEKQVISVVGEKNTRMANSTAEFLPLYSGIKDHLKGETMMGETLANPHLSVGEKSVEYFKWLAIKVWGDTQIVMDVMTLGSSSLVKGLIKSTGMKLLKKAGEGIKGMGKEDEFRNKAPEAAAFSDRVSVWSQKTDRSHTRVRDRIAAEIDQRIKIFPPRPVAAGA